MTDKEEYKDDELEEWLEKLPNGEPWRLVREISRRFEAIEEVGDIREIVEDEWSGEPTTVDQPLEHWRWFYESHRDVLLDDLEGLTIEDLDRQIFPGTMSVGTSILHILGYEYLLTKGITLERGNSMNDERWDVIRHGFYRDLGLNQIEGRSPEFYTDLLAEVRADTNALLNEAERVVFQPPDFESVLLEFGEPPERAEKLAVGVVRKTMGAEQVNIPVTIAKHESYHRGQITFMKYLYSSSIIR